MHRLNCGCEVKDFDDGYGIRYPVEECDPETGFYRAIAFSTYCESCAREWEINGWLILDEEDECKWMEGCPVYQKRLARKKAIEERNEYVKKQMKEWINYLMLNQGNTNYYNDFYRDELFKLIDRVTILEPEMDYDY